MMDWLISLFLGCEGKEIKAFKETLYWTVSSLRTETQSALFSGITPVPRLPQQWSVKLMNHTACVFSTL